MNFEGAEGLEFGGGNTDVDPAVLAVLPEGSKITSTDLHGVSFWAKTGRLDTTLPDGTANAYFIKTLSRETGANMVRGEYEAMKTIYSVLPDFAPKPIAYGTYVSIPDTHFFICEFRNMSEEMPDPHKFTSRLAALHQNSVSPNGKFGFGLTTYAGNKPQFCEWESSWETFFAKSLRWSLDLEIEAKGYDSGFDSLVPVIFERVIPRLLRPLESEGRTVKPSLVHGDLWYANSGIDVDSDDSLVFDACCFYAHNEYEFGQWRPVCNRFGAEYLDAYHSYVEISAPAEDYDGRLDLYKLRFNTHVSALFTESKALREQVLGDMKDLVQRYGDSKIEPLVPIHIEVDKEPISEDLGTEEAEPAAILKQPIEVEKELPSHPIPEFGKLESVFPGSEIVNTESTVPIQLRANLQSESSLKVEQTIPNTDIAVQGTAIPLQLNDDKLRTEELKPDHPEQGMPVHKTVQPILNLEVEQAVPESEVTVQRTIIPPVDKNEKLPTEDIEPDNPEQVVPIDVKENLQPKLDLEAEQIAPESEVAVPGTISPQVDDKKLPTEDLELNKPERAVPIHVKETLQPTSDAKVEEAILGIEIVVQGITHPPQVNDDNPPIEDHEPYTDEQAVPTQVKENLQLDSEPSEPKLEQTVPHTEFVGQGTTIPLYANHDVVSTSDKRLEQPEATIPININEKLQPNSEPKLELEHTLPDTNVAVVEAPTTQKQTNHNILPITEPKLEHPLSDSKTTVNDETTTLPQTTHDSLPTSEPKLEQTILNSKSIIDEETHTHPPLTDNNVPISEPKPDHILPDKEIATIEAPTTSPQTTHDSLPTSEPKAEQTILDSNTTATQQPTLPPQLTHNNLPISFPKLGPEHLPSENDELPTPDEPNSEIEVLKPSHAEKTDLSLEETLRKSERVLQNLDLNL